MAKRAKGSSRKQEEVEIEREELDDDSEDLDIPNSDDDLNEFSDESYDDLDEPTSKNSRRSSDDDLKAIDSTTALIANPKRAQIQRKAIRNIDGIKSLKALEVPETGLKIWKKLEKSNSKVKAKEYKVTDDYSLDDVIQHPMFGRGYVIEFLTDTKLAILFEIGIKRLIYNKK